MFVESGRNGLFVPEYDRRRAPNSGHVCVAQLDKFHQLAHKSLHVGPWLIARLTAHTAPPPATAWAKGASLTAPLPSRVLPRALPTYGPTVRDRGRVRQEVSAASLALRERL